MVLCSRTEKRNAADINFFNCFCNCNVDLGYGVLKRVKIADDIVYLVDVLFCKIFLVRLEVTSKYTLKQDWRVSSIYPVIYIKITVAGAYQHEPMDEVFSPYHQASLEHE
jgi:hypothetical protein